MKVIGEIYAEIINSPAEDSACEIYLVKTSTGGILFPGNIKRFPHPGRIVAKVAGKSSRERRAARYSRYSQSWQYG